MEKKRLPYIDNVRLWIIILVVLIHIAITYLMGSNWYYVEKVTLAADEQTFFSFLCTIIQAFSMGLLFLIAGYFVPGAYDRKGFKVFMGDRAIRLGIPVLIYVFLVDPFTEYVLAQRYVLPGQDFFSYWVSNITNGHFLTGTGPLWFAVALLVFTLIYAVVRLIVKYPPADLKIKIKPNAKTLLLLVLIIAAFAFLIRIWAPIGTAFYNMKLCFFSQYIVLFIVGIIAYRQGLFSKLSYKLGLRLLWTAPLWGFIGWGAMMIACQMFWGGDYNLYNGGLTWQSVLFAVWESFAAVAMSVGLLAVCREKCNRQGRLTKTLSDGAFAVYVFHTPIIVWIALLFAGVQLPAVAKFFILIPICLPVCFAAAYLLRKIPLLKKVI